MPYRVDGEVLIDGSLDFSGGVDSIKVTTIQSQANPDGLARNEQAWLDNATVRDGGITQRTGWQLNQIINNGQTLYQGGFMYQPLNANPYLVLCFGGHVFQVMPDAPTLLVDLSAKFGKSLPQFATHYYFVQAEQFLVIQAGDNSTLPLIWDGALLRQSRGITNTSVAPGTPGVNEIPAATAMDYYMGRIWFARGRQVFAGDIVFGTSGTAPYNFTDAVLNVTESPLVLGGDGFMVPTQSGNIRALFHNANLNSQLGQGQLFVGTHKEVYSLQVPVTRSQWTATNNQNQPVMVPVQLVNGPVGDRCIVQVNGDVFYQSLEPGIRSLFASIRYFTQWGNIQISANEQRILNFVNRALLEFSSGIEFDNRMLQTSLPVQKPQGVVHQAIIPMDFVPISQFGANLEPVWEGMYEGLDFFQLFRGDFGGLERAFGVILSRIDQSIQLYELTNFQRTDFNDQITSNNPTGEARVTWIIEFPAYTWGSEWLLKRLYGGEIWVDKVFGKVEFQLDYRPDGETCWIPWHKWDICSARNSCEDVFNPVCYPLVQFGETYRQTMTIPRPPDKCETIMARPADRGFQFQPRLTIKGWCRIRGILLKALPLEKKLWLDMTC